MDLDKMTKFDDEFDFISMQHESVDMEEQIEPHPKRQRFDKDRGDDRGDDRDTLGGTATARRTVEILDGQSIVTLCSPQVFACLGKSFPRRLCKPPPFAVYTRPQKDFLKRLFDEYAGVIESSVFSAMMRGKKEQFINFDFEKFKADYSLNLGRPRIVQDTFINELKRNDPNAAFTDYGGKLFGASHRILGNEKFTVEFFW